VHQRRLQARRKGVCQRRGRRIKVSVAHLRSERGLRARANYAIARAEYAKYAVAPRGRYRVACQQAAPIGTYSSMLCSGGQARRIRVHDAQRMRARVSGCCTVGVASFLRSTVISYPPFFQSGLEWGSRITNRALLSGCPRSVVLTFTPLPVELARPRKRTAPGKLHSDAYSSQSTPNAHPMDRAPDVLTARIDRSLHAQASTRAQSSSTVGRKS
jgi:hypothetical protein